MGSLSSIATISIVTQATGPSRKGFGTPLLAVYHTQTAQTVKEYTSLVGVENDFGTGHAAYRMAQAVFSQNPRPPKLKIGKRTSAHTQTIKLTPQTTQEGYKYSVTIGGEEATYTVQSGDTTANVVSGLVTAINSLSVAVTATDNTSDLTVASDSSGDLFVYEPDAELDVSDDTSDPGIQSDLNSIESADDDWYGLVLDSQSQAEVEQAASWIETRDKIMLADNADTAMKDSGSSSDLAANIQSNTYARTGVLYHHIIGDYLAPALFGKQLPKDAGSETYAYQTLAGIASTPRSFLGPNDKSGLEGKDAGYYTSVASLANTFWGKNGAGSYIDIVETRDWLRARMQERILAVLSNAGKVPYTVAGARTFTSEIKGQLEEGADNGLVVFDSITVSDPADLIDNASSTDKANRELKNVEFSATLQGAVHKLDISGVLSV